MNFVKLALGQKAAAFKEAFQKLIHTAAAAKVQALRPVNEMTDENHFSDFKSNDYLGFAGASNLPDGSKPKISHQEGGTVIHSGDEQGGHHVEVYSGGWGEHAHMKTGLSEKEAHKARHLAVHLLRNHPKESSRIHHALKASGFDYNYVGSHPSVGGSNTNDEPPHE